MSVQSPPTLLKLARQAVLRDEALAISGLETLPVELFPALFKEAFTGRHLPMVRAIVASWPFPCLPVGALMKNPDLETFQAVLAGIDMCLQRQRHPRRGKMKVLDLRTEDHEFWSIWAGAEAGGCSAESVKKKQVEKRLLPRYALRQRQRPLKVVADLCLRPHLQAEQACFLQWAQQRQGSLQLCCKKMEVWAQPVPVVRQVLTAFHPEHIEEFQLNTEWNVATLAQFAPRLGQMRNLRRFSLAPFSKNLFKVGSSTTDREEKCVSKLLAQLSRFQCLQHLCVNRVHFLRDHMSQALGCLRIPLETLCITHQQMSQSDLNSFSCCPKLFQLKQLDMRGVVLRTLDVMPLGVLLEQVADTLQALDLTGCKLRDSHLTVLIPALSKCCQLTKVSLYENDFSMARLSDLLQHTGNLSSMNVEQYPAPLECYGALGYVFIERFAQLCPVLVDTLRAIRQPKCISFATDVCPRSGLRCFYEPGSRLRYAWG